MLFKASIYLMIGVSLLSCGVMSTFEVAPHMAGYVEPPEETTILEELKLEFRRCIKVDSDRNCAQLAYDVVRRVKGLEPRTVPKGIVIIFQDISSSDAAENKN